MFQGFSQNAIDFLWGISLNNERGWFMAHKQDFTDYVDIPMRELGKEVFSALAEEGGFPALTVSGWEVQQAALGKRNYTVLTLEMLAAGSPGAELYLAIGSDMLLSFDGWYRWQDILRLARLVVTSRNVGDDPLLHEKAKQLDATGARILFAPVEALPMASSALRARLAAGERCENELPPLVRRVIQREGLYRETKGDEDRNDSETGKRACAQPPERSAL